MVIGSDINGAIKIPIKKACEGYYIRWYYNGWHYWFLLPGRYGIVTEGEQYRTIGTRRVLMGTGNITLSQAIALKSLLHTKEIYLLTNYGWMNVRFDPSTINTYDNQVGGVEMEFVMFIGSKELSYKTGFSPVKEIPEEVTACDWFLPSTGDWQLIYDNLYAKGKGNFGYLQTFWSSSESNATYGYSIRFNFTYLDSTSTLKSANLNIRACRTFISDNNYNLGETGPGGGYIYYINGNIYSEVMKENLGISIWSNISLLIGTTSQAAGTGNQNTLDIINQAGHITSAALLCHSYCITIPVEIVYCEITIGTQVWMCANWDTNFPGSKAYNNDELNVAEYGRLYNWPQITTPGFAPEGWRVPTLDDWNILIAFIGGLSTAGKLKETGTTHWDAPNTGANNEHNFDMRGGGLLTNYSFINLKIGGYYWTQTEVNANQTYSIRGLYNSAALSTFNLAKNGLDYASIRLIKNISVPPVFTDWFLPSQNELNAIYDNLHLFGVGGFTNDPYWSSHENITAAWGKRFSDGALLSTSKSSTYRVRASRSFIASAGLYSLRDTGPGGGLIFYINGNIYYEAASADQSAGHRWSNITTQIGTTSAAIGEGINNTDEIIAQVGHTDSAAKICKDYS